MSGWTLAIVALAITTGVTITVAVAFLLGNRRRVQPPVPPHGTRPEVILHADGIDYDLTETGERLPDRADGMARWLFHGPSHYTRPPGNSYVEIRKLAPRTCVEVLWVLADDPAG